jgi:hypothetical protein
LSTNKTMDKLTIEKEIASLAVEIKNATENTSTSDFTKITQTVEKAAELYKKTVLWEYICNNTPEPAQEKTIEHIRETEQPVPIIAPIEEHVPSMQEVNTVVIETPVAHIETLTIETEITKPELHIIDNIPVIDIKKHIGFNDKFELINELFRGNSNNYEIAVTKINAASTAQEALKTFSNFKIANGWSDDNESTLKLQEIIQNAFK